MALLDNAVIVEEMPTAIREKTQEINELLTHSYENDQALALPWNLIAETPEKAVSAVRARANKLAYGLSVRVQDEDIFIQAKVRRVK